MNKNRIKHTWSLLLIGVLFSPLLHATSITATVIGVRQGGNVNIQILNSTSFANPTSGWGGQIELTFDGGDYMGELLPDATSNIIAYCLEPDEHIGYNTYDMTVSSLDQAGTGMGGIGATRARQIQDLLYHIVPVFQTTSLSNTQALATQVALWEIVSEIDTGPYDLASGNARFTTTGNATTTNALALAQSWLNNYVNDTTGGPYDTQLLSLTKVGVQDLLVKKVVRKVSAPAGILLLSLGLGLIVVRRRRAA